LKRDKISSPTTCSEFASKFPDKILDKTQLQRFLGSLNYVSHFIKDCAKDRRLLNQRLQKDPMPWTESILKQSEILKLKSGNFLYCMFQMTISLR
jgi:hypothetical protein